MKRLLARVSIVGGLTLVAACVAVIATGPSLAQAPAGPSVLVVNPTGQPVPTRIVNSVPLQTTIVGSLPAPVDNRTPVTFSGVMVAEAGSRVVSEEVTTVPMGQRFVIEYVTFAAGVENGGLGSVPFNFSLHADHAYQIGNVEASGNRVASLSLLTKIYIDGGLPVTARAYRGADKTDNVPVRYSLTGYLEPL